MQLQTTTTNIGKKLQKLLTTFLILTTTYTQIAFTFIISNITVNSLWLKVATSQVARNVIGSQVARNVAGSVVAGTLINTLSTKSAHALENTNPVDYIKPDGSTNTTVDRTQNNTPVIYIANPSDGGVSVNRYEDFNSTYENMILNNHKGDVGLSNIGGAMNGNPNFNVSGGREADIILNEVTSNKITNLNGYTEIFGKRAELIIANPNGISIKGAGFINTSRLGLITGSHKGLDANGNLTEFDLSKNPNANITITGRDVYDDKGNLIIMNLGLDASNVDYTDIISRVVKIQGDIYAKNLNIRTGNKKAVRDNNATDLDNAWTTESEETSDSQLTKPEFAIDSTAFGGMYAGRINIIATEKGVGVSTVGDLSSNVDDINITADGKVELNNDSIYAKRDISITSIDNDINNNTKIVADNNISINAKNNFNNSLLEFDTAGNPIFKTNGIVYAGKDITIIADRINNNYTNNIDTSNTNYAYVGITSQGNINLNVNYLNNDNGRIRAVNDFNLIRGRLAGSVSENIDNKNGNIISGGNLTITAKDFDNTNNGYLRSDRDMTLTLINAINNQGGKVISNRDLTIITENLDNSSGGYLYSERNTNLQNLNNNTGTIESRGNITINNTNSALDNTSGNIKAIGTPTASSSATSNVITLMSSMFILNNLGSVLTTGNIDIDVTGDYTITGAMQANGHVDIEANNITNDGDLQASEYIKLIANGWFTNSADKSLISDDYILISALYNLNNYGTISAGTDMDLTAGDILYNMDGARISGGSGITSLTAENSIQNRGFITGQSDLQQCQ